MGGLVHHGSIGNTYYDKDAIQKEAKYSAGITFDEAVNIFISETNSNAIDLNTRYKNFKIDKTLVDQNTADALADIYFNSGTKNVRKAFKIYAKNGKQGLIDAIKAGTVTSPSKERKNFRLDILEKGVYNVTDQKVTPVAPATPIPIIPKKSDYWLDRLYSDPDMRALRRPSNIL